MHTTNPNPNPLMETMLNDHVFPIYKCCVDRAKLLFTDESAIQSASATMFINLYQNSKTASILESKLRDKIAKLNPDAIPSAIEVWKWHFRDLIAELGPRIVGQIAYCVMTCLSNEELENHIIQYATNLREMKKER